MNWLCCGTTTKCWMFCGLTRVLSWRTLLAILMKELTSSIRTRSIIWRCKPSWNANPIWTLLQRCTPTRIIWSSKATDASAPIASRMKVKGSSREYFQYFIQNKFVERIGFNNAHILDSKTKISININDIEHSLFRSDVWITIRRVVIYLSSSYYRLPCKFER